MTTVTELEDKVIGWASHRGIFQHCTMETQCLKLMSEVGELADNILSGDDIKDDIGDCMVLLINIAHLKGTDLTECLNVAYNDIKDRKGFINDQGCFIKEVN